MKSMTTMTSISTLKSIRHPIRTRMNINRNFRLRATIIACFMAIWSSSITAISQTFNWKVAESRDDVAQPSLTRNWHFWSVNFDARNICRWQIAAMSLIRSICPKHKSRLGIRIEGPNGNDKINCDWNSCGIRRRLKRNWSQLRIIRVCIFWGRCLNEH